MAVGLRTERLVLRPIDTGDTDALHALHTDDEVMRYLPGERGQDVRAGTLPRMLAWAERDPAWGYSAAIERGTGTFLGWFVFRPAMDRAPVEGELEIGSRFTRAAWGHGYATEGARALLRHGFTVLDVRSVFATTMPDNIRSQRVMERLGLRRLPDVDPGEVEYRIDRDEWAERFS